MVTKTGKVESLNSRRGVFDGRVRTDDAGNYIPFSGVDVQLALGDHVEFEVDTKGMIKSKTIRRIG